jgi:hypothetical protein
MARQAFSNGSTDTLPKIYGYRTGHLGWPPSPAIISNHKKTFSGIPTIQSDKKML